MDQNETLRFLSGDRTLSMPTTVEPADRIDAGWLMRATTLSGTNIVRVSTRVTGWEPQSPAWTEQWLREHGAIEAEPAETRAFQPG